MPRRCGRNSRALRAAASAAWSFVGSCLALMDRLLVPGTTFPWTKCSSRPTILQLLLQNVLSKRELRSHNEPHAVTTAIQYVREKIIMNKVGGHAKAEVWSDLPAHPTSEAVKHYRVRGGGLTEEGGDNLLGDQVFRLGRNTCVECSQRRTREEGHLFQSAVIELRSSLIRVG